MSIRTGSGINGTTAIVGGAVVVAVAGAVIWAVALRAPTPPAPAPESIAAVEGQAGGEGAEAPAAEPAVQPGGDGSEPVPPVTAAEDQSMPDDGVAPEAQAAVEGEADPEEPAPAPEPPRFDVVRVDPQGGAVIAGRAPAGTEVLLMLDGEQVEVSQADASGAFVAMLSLPPADAPRRLSLETAGDTGDRLVSDQTVIIAPIAAADTDGGGGGDAADVPDVADATAGVDETGLPQSAPDAIERAAAPDAAGGTNGVGVSEPPTAEADVEDGPARPTVLIADADGVRVIQSGGTGEAPEVQDQVLLDTIAYDTRGEVVLSGRGAGEGDVRVYLDNRPVQLARIGPGGAWQTELPEVDPGTYTLRVDQVSAEGTVVSRLETPFLREDPEVLEAVAVNEDGITVVTVQRGFTLWGIAENMMGEGILYVHVYEANRGLIRDPDLIYPGQVFAIPELTE